MRSKLVAVLVAVLAAQVPARATSHPYPKPPLSDWCRYRWVDGSRVYISGVFAMIDCFARSMNVSRSTARQVADDESSGYPYARSPSGEYLGVYQLGSGEFSTWWRELKSRFKGRLLKPGRAARRFNARANVLAALYWVHRHGWGWRCHPFCTYRG